VTNAGNISSNKSAIGSNISSISAIESDYLTSSSLSGYATENYVDEVLASSGAVAGLSDYLTVDERTNAVVFSGANVFVQSGSGFTDDNVTSELGGDGTGRLTGLGNLIIGYDEDASVAGYSANDKGGSHNLVVGALHTYSSVGGFIAGLLNSVTNNFSVVSGGFANTASGQLSVVSGGDENLASGESSTVSGGYQSTASALYSSVSGGYQSTASGIYSSVSGGYQSTASGSFSSVSGGYQSTASGSVTSVSGGYLNTASGSYSVVTGGYLNEAEGSFSSVSGGLRGVAAGVVSSISGGSNNTASGNYSSISGGRDNTTSTAYSYAP
jgi:hypothetical protein